jgi:peptide/nickel transport system substrate-binding protein
VQATKAPLGTLRSSLSPALVLLFLVAGASGCRSAAPGEALVVALEAMPENLDPRFSTDAASSRIGDLLFRSLTRPGPNEEPLPDLASSWRFEDSRTVVFELRSDATFSDGSPLTAEDVRATYESILDPAMASPKRALLEVIEAIETPATHTVRFRLKETHAPFFEATRIGILSRAFLEGRTRDLLGSGPFRLAEVVPGREIVLRAVDSSAGLRAIRFRAIPDETVRALELRQGNVHFVQNGVEPDTLAWLAAGAKLCVRRLPGTTFQYLGMNLRDPILADRRVRRALAHAIDRDALVAHLLRGTARPADSLLAPEHWAHAEGLPRIRYDPEAARRLLDEAGYPDPDGEGPAVRFRLGYRTTPLASRRRLAEALQAMLREVGVGLDIATYEWGTFYEDVRRGNFQLYGLAWVGVSDPDIFFDILSSERIPPRGNNRGGFRDPEVDRLVWLGRRTLDPKERREIYGRLQRIVAEELPFVPLWWEDVVVVHDQRLCGFEPYPNGSLISLRTAWWDEGRAGTGPCGCPVEGAQG